eukprot:3740839-Amphidinium_carterae.2
MKGKSASAVRKSFCPRACEWECFPAFSLRLSGHCAEKQKVENTHNRLSGKGVRGVSQACGASFKEQ